jgi:hypothetical protein
MVLLGLSGRVKKESPHRHCSPADLSAALLKITSALLNVKSGVFEHHIFLALRAPPDYYLLPLWLGPPANAGVKLVVV